MGRNNKDYKYIYIFFLRISKLHNVKSEIYYGVVFHKFTKGRNLQYEHAKNDMYFIHGGPIELFLSLSHITVKIKCVECVVKYNISFLPSLLGRDGT